MNVGAVDIGVGTGLVLKALGMAKNTNARISASSIVVDEEGDSICIFADGSAHCWACL